MNAENEYRPEDLKGEAGALWLDDVGAFDGVRVAFTTNETLSRGAAAGFAGDARDADGGIDEEFVARLCATVGFPYGRLATCRQVHGTRICRVEAAERRVYEKCDGLATDFPDAPVAVFAADCVPVVIYAPRPGAFALVHAGWRGTIAKIVAGAVRLLQACWDAAPAELNLFLGPAVGPCCYEVGADVVGAAEGAFGAKAGQVLLNKNGSRRLDLHRANELAAQEAGVRAENIYRVATCTSCAADLFPSRRREGDAAGRMMAVAAVAGPMTSNLGRG